MLLATASGRLNAAVEEIGRELSDSASIAERADDEADRTDKVVQDPSLSLSGGAVRGWDRRNAYYYQMFQTLAEHYGFDLDTAFRDLPERVRQVVLHGGDEIGFGRSRRQ